jgi:hypothetical protein
LRRASGESHALVVRQYDADHEMVQHDARRDRASFLAETIGRSSAISPSARVRPCPT